MKLLFLTTSYPRFPGDEASIFVARLAESLRNLVSDLRVIVPIDNEEPQEEITNTPGGSILISRFQYRIGLGQGLAFGAGLVPNLRARPWQAWQLLTLVLQMFRRSRPFIKSDTKICANWILAGFVARLLHDVTGVEYIYIVRGLEMKVANNFLGRLLFDFVIKKSKATVCVSKSFKADLHKSFPNYINKIISIPNGVGFEMPSSHDISIFEETHGLKVSRPYLLMVGTVIPRKNIEAAIKMMSEGLATKYDLRILGRLNDVYYVENLRALAEKLEVQKSIIFHGEVSPSEVPLFLKCSKGFISCSTHEGLPNSLLEALAAGRLVCVSDIPPHREIIQAEDSGIIFSLDSPEEIVPRLLNLIENEEERTQFERKAQATVQTRTWESCALNYVEALRKL